MTGPRSSLALAFAVSALAACGAQPPSLGTSESALTNPPLAVTPFKGDGSPEPGIAVGKNYVFSMSSGRYEVFSRDAIGNVKTTTPALADAALSDSTLFGSIVQQLNGKMFTPDATGGVSPCTLSTIPSDSTLGWDEIGCLDQPYDSDVIYDPVRDRFWIMAHLRNHIYPCSDPTKTEADGWYTTTFDQNQDPSNPTCHQDTTHKLEPKRFIAVAVTHGNSLGQDTENPHNGYYVYVLVDEDGDWPQMMLHGDYLLLDTRSPKTNDAVHVFNATQLANNAHGSPSVLTETEWPFHLQFTTAYDWSQNLPLPVVLDTPIFFVKQPYAPDDPTYLVGGSGTKLVFFAIPPLAGGSSPPAMPTPTMVDVGTTVPFGLNNDTLNRGNFVPGAYQNGKFYWAWPGAENDDYSPGRHTFIRTFRVPLTETTLSGQATLKATTSASDGYLAVTAGETDTTETYELPVVGVNQNNDWVVEFSRYTQDTVPPDVRYLVMYHDQTSFNGSMEIKQGDFLPVGASGKSLYPGSGGNIDTPSVVADPLSPTMMWMSYGVPFSSWNASRYSSVISAIDIGPCAGDHLSIDRFRIGLLGCGGADAWAYAAPLCSPHYHVCSADEWDTYFGATSTPKVPTADYWTSDLLGRSGSVSGACEALSSGGTSCGSMPMHVCTGGTDGFGNTCALTGCGYDGTGDEYFGGCGAPSAGALCCADVP